MSEKTHVAARISLLKYDAGLGENCKKYGLFCFKAMVNLKYDMVKRSCLHLRWAVPNSHCLTCNNKALSPFS